jgi:hypothetical protein
MDSEFQDKHKEVKTQVYNLNIHIYTALAYTGVVTLSKINDLCDKITTNHNICRFEIKMNYLIISKIS